MGSFLSLPLLALAAIVQSTVTPQVSILGGRPGLIFLLVLGWSVHASLEESVVWAFVGGILQDVYSATPTGASAITLILLVFTVNYIQARVYQVGVLGLLALTLVGTLVQQIVLMLILFTSGFGPAFTGRLGFGVILENISYVVLPTMLYNLLLVLPVYFIVRRIQRRVYRNRITPA
jgi:rod shape-determining protein MreD